MKRILKYLFFDKEGETTRFKPAPAFLMILLLLLFQASILYVVLSTLFGS
jgi:hypothetical protein